MFTNIFNLENWREIGTTLARNKTRTFLTAFGIFWGTAMLTLLVGGATGARGMLSRNFAGMASNMGGVASNVRTMSYKGFNKGSSWQLKSADIDAIRAVAPAIEASSEVNGARVTAAYGDKSYSGSATGIEADFARIQIPVVTAGRFINQSDVDLGRKSVVIGRNIVPELFGTEDPVGKTLSLNGVYFTVVGVAGQLGEASIMSRVDDSFVMPVTTMRRTFNQGDYVGFFIFTAPEGSRPADNINTIRRVLSSRHAIHPDDTNAIWFMDIAEMFEQINMVFLGFSLLALFVGLGSLMAGVIGVGNIMWIIVRERTHEFGIRRAIGAKPADITLQVLCESIVLTLVAGIAGVCFAAIILGIADKMTFDPLLGNAGFEISFAKALAIVAAFFILGSAAGTLPAIKAMTIKPIEALRDK